LPVESRQIKSDEGNVPLDFQLTKAKDVEGTVWTTDGVPAAGAKVALGIAGSQIMVMNGDISETQTLCERQKTNAAGRYHFPPAVNDFCLVITHPYGYARRKCAPNANPKIIHLIPWARVEGTFRVGRKPQPNVAIWIDQHALDLLGANLPNIFIRYETTTVADGRFVFERVLPGKGSIGRNLHLTANWRSSEAVSSGMIPATFVPGETTRIDPGSSGRPVIGQLRRAPGSTEKTPWSYALVEADADDPHPLGDAPHFTASVDRDGNFCIDDVPPGRYWLSARFTKSNAEQLPRYNFRVPAIQEKLSQRPVDLGVLTLEAGAR
jgi:hypothetical protein